MRPKVCSSERILLRRGFAEYVAHTLSLNRQGSCRNAAYSAAPKTGWSILKICTDYNFRFGNLAGAASGRIRRSE